MVKKGSWKHMVCFVCNCCSRCLFQRRKYNMTQYVYILSEICRLVVENSIIWCGKKCKYTKKLCSRMQRMLKKLCSRMSQMRDYPAWYLCQKHSKTGQNVLKSQKMVRTPHQIWPKIWESDRKCASNLIPNFEKCRKIRLKSDPKLWKVAKNAPQIWPQNSDTSARKEP